MLPPPPTSDYLRLAVRATLDLRKLGRSDIIDPLLAFTYRAPLAAIAPLDFSLALTGPTGVFKTELAGLAQGHFGAGFNGRTLPGSWKSTSNSLERLLFIAKDAIVAVDDFAPGGNAAEVSRYHREADNLLRGIGNRSGRGRLRPDGTARPAYRPRGATLTTGEDIPRGHSLRARMLILEISPGDVAVRELSQAQKMRDQGVYAAAMAGYLQWLAPILPELKDELGNLRLELRNQSGDGAGRHRRIIKCGACGCSMGPTFSTRRGRQYRYYLCTQAGKKGYAACPVKSVAAGTIEAAVVDQLRVVLRSPEIVARTFREARLREVEEIDRLRADGDESNARRLEAHAVTENEVIEALQRFDNIWSELFPAEQHRIVQLLLERVDVKHDGIELRLRADGLKSLVAELRVKNDEAACP